MLALPDQPSPLLTRALFYRHHPRQAPGGDLALPARLAEAVSTRAERAAGLAERLVLAGAVADADAVPDAPIGAAPAEAISSACSKSVRGCSKPARSRLIASVS